MKNSWFRLAAILKVGATPGVYVLVLYVTGSASVALVVAFAYLATAILTVMTGLPPPHTRLRPGGYYTLLMFVRSGVYVIVGVLLGLLQSRLLALLAFVAAGLALMAGVVMHLLGHRQERLGE